MNIHPSDAQLWERLRADDRDAWGLLFDRHSARIYRFAVRMAGDAEAEEVLADTFVEVWRSRRSFVVREETAVPILIAIARRVVQKRSRSGTRRRRLWQTVAHHESANLRNPEGDVAEDVVTRDEQAGRRAWLRVQVAALPPACRDAFELVVYAELTQAEVASVLGVPVGTVKSRLSRARQILIEQAGIVGVRPEHDLHAIRTGE